MSFNDLDLLAMDVVRENLSPEGNRALAASCRSQYEDAQQFNYWGRIAEMLGIESSAQDTPLEGFGSEDLIHSIQMRETKKQFKNIHQVVLAYLRSFQVANSNKVGFLTPFRYFKRKTTTLVNPKKEAPRIVYKTYQKIYAEDLLKFSNNVADQLGIPQFADADNAREWFQDPNNQGSLQTITGLRLRRCNFHVLPREIGQLTDLRLLYIEGNKLTNLPSEIENLTHLFELNISQNRIKELPSEIGELIQLKELDATDNILTKLPTEIGQLTHLDNLRLNNNLLEELPSEIGELTQTDIDVAYNPLTSLSDDIRQMPQIKGLDAQDSEINRLVREETQDQYERHKI